MSSIVRSVGARGWRWLAARREASRAPRRGDRPGWEGIVEIVSKPPAPPVAVDPVGASPALVSARMRSLRRARKTLPRNGLKYDVQVDTVNVGEARAIRLGERTITTATWKHPVNGP